MAKKPPVVRGTKLFFFDQYTGETVYMLDIKRDWSRWQKWLEENRSFRFEATNGTRCSVKSERRRSYGRKDKTLDAWYAYKTLDKRRRHKYLGLAENVTAEKLEAVSFELSQHKLER